MAAARMSEGSLSGRGPFLLMVIPDQSGLRVAGLDGSGYGDAELGRFVDSWGGALRESEARISRQPDEPGLVRSVFNLVSAILRTFGGMLRGVVTAL